MAVPGLAAWHKGPQLLAPASSGAPGSGGGALQPQPYPQFGLAAGMSPTAAAGGSAFDSGSAVSYWSGPSAGMAVSPNSGNAYMCGTSAGAFYAADAVQQQQQQQQQQPVPHLFQIMPQQLPYSMACALPSRPVFQVAAAQVLSAPQEWQLQHQQLPPPQHHQLQQMQQQQQQ
jgi:hypothetical protein